LKACVAGCMKMLVRESPMYYNTNALFDILLMFGWNVKKLFLLNIKSD
jgi:hypothetical protein